MDAPYKLIAHPAEEKQPRIPFYGYTVEDPDGKEVSHASKVVITIDPDKNTYATMTLHLKWIDQHEDVKERILENLPVEFEVREGE